MKLRLAVIAVLAGGVSAFGQMVLPRGRAPEKTPEFTPPPMPPPVTEQPKPVIKPLPPPEPDPAYESLVKKDENGKVMRLKEPVDYAALRNNTRIKDDQRGRVDEYLITRRKQVEEVVIRNLDLLEKVDNGDLSKLNPMEREDLKKFTDIIMPLQVKPPAAQALERDGVINKATVQFNNKIAREYRTALQNEAKSAAGEEKKDQAKNMSVIMGLEACEEVMWARRGMALEVAERWSEVISKASGASSEIEKAASAAKGAVMSAKSGEEKAAAVVEFARKLPLDARKALFESVISTRKQ